MIFIERYTAFSNFWTISVMQGPVTIVYQMGKVGSRSVFESLQQCGVKPIFHLHRMLPANIAMIKDSYRQKKLTPLDEKIGPMLYKKISNGRKKAKIITLVREPLGRNISAFFQNLQFYVGPKYNDADLQLADLIETFLADYSHDVPLQWFNSEFEKTTGINVYRYPFPIDKGYVTIERKNIELLLIKLELPDVQKERAIADFMKIDEFRLVNRNMAKDKSYSASYQKFKKAIRLPGAYVHKMLTSRYATHFYSEKEISALWNRWHEGYLNS
jgi:hypothetical protein